MIDYKNVLLNALQDHQQLRPIPQKTKEPGCRAFRYDNPVLTSNPYIYI